MHNRSYLSRELLLSALLFFCALPAFGKGLDNLQADTEKPADQVSPLPAEATSEVPPAPNPVQPAVQTLPPGTPPLTQTAPFEAEKLYLATSLSWLNLTGSKGGWHTSTTSDIEAGYRVLTLLQKFDLFGTFRYRPVDVLVNFDQRQYRGIVESYLFGAKAKLALNTRLLVLASAELGASQAHLHSIDSLREVDQSLAKSGVDLSLGAGVSYLVLDKFGVGTKVALGAGAFKTIQIGVDLRFLL